MFITKIIKNSADGILINCVEITKPEFPDILHLTC
jgi:hypothetical protein